MDKPVYRVPLMQEIAALPWNGYDVISTFSGGGGSSLGYKMAGYRVAWASEFIPAAQDTYRANHQQTILDTRDIREVQVQDILESIGKEVGDLDVFDGSPPCAAFSTAGKREAGWNKIKPYSDTKQRTDDLFFEYARLVRGIQPKVFVAENVSGLVRGVAKGYFLEILSELRQCGYAVSAQLLDAQWLGVPQMRQRVIFVGVRNDLVERFGVKPAHPKPLPYRYTVKEAIPWVTRLKIAGRPDNWQPSDRPAGTVMASDSARQPTSTAYMSSYVIEAETDLSGYATSTEWERLIPGETSARYFNLKRVSADDVCKTVTAIDGSSGRASVAHPTEKRKFSIAELKRICAFPDDFVLTGSYAQQWERLGRAVPPVMMMHIAKTIATEVLDRCKA